MFWIAEETSEPFAHAQVTRSGPRLRFQIFLVQKSKSLIAANSSLICVWGNFRFLLRLEEKGEQLILPRRVYWLRADLPSMTMGIWPKLEIDKTNLPGDVKSSLASFLALLCVTCKASFDCSPSALSIFSIYVIISDEGGVWPHFFQNVISSCISIDERRLAWWFGIDLDFLSRLVIPRSTHRNRSSYLNMYFSTWFVLVIVFRLPVSCTE